MNRQYNVAELKRLLRERKGITRFLTSKGVLPELAEKVTLEFTQSAQEMGALPTILARYIRVTGELTFEKPRTLALVGPTGVGKSTTIRKLAEHYRAQNKKVAIGTEESKDADLTILDTEGCNYYQESRVDALGEYLADFPNVQILLCLSASTKEVDLYGAIHQFSSLQPESLIFTKLDETLTLGTLLNICAKSKLPIRYTAHGYPLPGILEVAKPHQIIRKMLADLNTEEFQKLRYILTK
ncbi:MAG: ATP-binding cassette domain-containing protein [Chlamydiales bacterium]|nr:ATP-binding cassette domain-containing protein [Chlamydiales bacterium]